MTTNDRMPAPEQASNEQHTRPETRALSRAECEEWIAGHDEARLGFDTGRGHRSVVVGYAVGAAEVLLLLPEYHPATGYVMGAPVTLEVEAAVAEDTFESVRATGVAYPGSATEAESWHPYGASWPPGVAAHPVHVPLEELEGALHAA